MSSPIPTAETALEAVRSTLGWTGTQARRFTTGLAFFVYEVTGPEGAVVVRIGLPDQSQVLKDGLRLSGQLRPLGVPLPEILADGTEAPCPFVVMERLAGRDLGDCIGHLNRQELEAIAMAVEAAQQCVARLGQGARFGYAPRPEMAPHGHWSDVVAASLDRSRKRIEANGLFDPALADRLQSRLDVLRPALDAIPATPFLHDTTTKNVIVSDAGQLSGIVDVDDLCFGDPRYTIALTRVALLAHGQASDYADIWLAVSGRPDDVLMGFYTTLFVLDFMSEHGMVFNGNPAPSEPSARDRLQALYLTALDG